MLIMFDGERFIPWMSDMKTKWNLIWRLWCWHISEVVSITPADMETTDHWIFQAGPHKLPVIWLPLQAFTYCFRSHHENIAWFALHVSQPHSDDQTVCGKLAQFALVTSFRRSHDERLEDSVVSRSLIKFWEKGEMNESASVIEGREAPHTAVVALRSVCSRWRSAPIIKKLHLVPPTGTDITTCPCAGTCSAVGPPDQSNTCSRNKPTQFLPSYNPRVAVHTHTSVTNHWNIFPKLLD